MQQSEIKLHASCFQYHWNTYPNERGLLCYNLNNSRNVIDGAQNRALGLIKGRSDMVYYCPDGRAKMIEFKTESGYQSKEQLTWQKTIESSGYIYVVVRTFDDFKTLMHHWHEK